MSRLAGPAGVIAALAIIVGFARLNGTERVTVDLGAQVFYRVPITVVAFSGVFVGMLVMLVAGIHADLKVRRFLRDRLQEESRQEQSRVDRYQQDLFQDVDESPPPNHDPELP